MSASSLPPADSRDANDDAGPGDVAASLQRDPDLTPRALPQLSPTTLLALLVAVPLLVPLLVIGAAAAVDLVANRTSNVLQPVRWTDRQTQAVFLPALRRQLDLDSRTTTNITQLTVYSAPRADGLETEYVSTPVAADDVFIELPEFPLGETHHLAFEVEGPDLPDDRLRLDSNFVITGHREWFAWSRSWLYFVTLVVCGTILGWIWLARRGRRVFVRRIPALEAVDEAVGRATEMGKPCLFVPGILDLNEIQTIAGLTMLGHVAQRTADYRSDLEVPTSKALVMTAAREAVEAAYLKAGQSDSYAPDAISYITDEQFGYVAYLSGWMVREEPAACFYLGAFFAESLILAETGNTIGAVQMAGTAEPSQLPFFVAACDYTLIGEEFFAASAYLSGDPDQLGTLRGQDTVKLLLVVFLIAGTVLATVQAIVA